jgi:hypothetical protein
MIGWIILTAIMLFFVWLIFGPIRFKINTMKHRYEVILPGIIRGMIIPTDDFLIFKLWITAIPIKFDPLKPGKSKKPKKKEKPEKKKKKRKKEGSIPINKIRKMAIRIMKSFTIEKLYWNMDTGDYVLNARLMPVFAAVSNNKRHLIINFQETNEFEIIVKNRIFNFIRIAIRTFIFKS